MTGHQCSQKLSPPSLRFCGAVSPEEQNKCVPLRFCTELHPRFPSPLALPVGRQVWYGLNTGHAALSGLHVLQKATVSQVNNPERNFFLPLPLALPLWQQLSVQRLG